MTISERIGAARRERRVLARVSRAAWRLEQAERERTWALVSARAEGISIRTLATAAGLSPSRVHQIVAAPGCAGPLAQPLPAPLRYQHLLEGIEVLNALACAEHDRL